MDPNKQKYTPISTMCLRFIDSECFILTGTFGSNLHMENALILVNRHFDHTRGALHIGSLKDDLMRSPVSVQSLLKQKLERNTKYDL